MFCGPTPNEKLIYIFRMLTICKTITSQGCLGRVLLRTFRENNCGLHSNQHQQTYKQTSSRLDCLYEEILEQFPKQRFDIKDS